MFTKVNSIQPQVQTNQTEDKAKSATKWFPGEVLTGFLLGTQVKQSRFGSMKQYLVQETNDDGSVETGKVVSLITSAGLEVGLSKVQPNQLVRIECRGGSVGSKKVNFDISTADKFKV